MSRGDNRGQLVGGGRGLTDIQRAFAEAYAADTGPLLGRGKRAAVVAGYSEASASVSAGNCLRNPAVLAKIREAQLRKVRAGYVGDALRVLHEIVTDDGESARNRIAAASKLVEVAGLDGSSQAALRKDSNADQSKPLSEMTNAELFEVIEAGRKAGEAVKAHVKRVTSSAPSQPDIVGEAESAEDSEV